MPPAKIDARSPAVDCRLLKRLHTGWLSLPQEFAKKTANVSFPRNCTIIIISAVSNLMKIKERPRLSAEQLMSPNPVTAPADERVSDALVTMCEKRIHNLPVMDKHGRFLGLFGLRHLLRALLPKAATISPALNNLDFLADNVDEVLQCLREIADDPVKNYLDTENMILCRTAEPIMEVMRKLYEAPTSLPVVLVEGDDARLVGMISYWDILAHISTQLGDLDARLESACVRRGGRDSASD
jgi:CBS domain-containing protein